MMTHGYVQQGTTKFSEVTWRLNLLVNCHNTDALWGSTTQAGEQCQMLVPNDVKDPVLWRLLKVGLNRNNPWHHLLTGLLDGDL